MTDDNNTHSGGSIPEAIVREKRSGMSLVWLVPIIAAVIGAWLAYKTVADTGPTVTLSFKTADGLEAGKTKVKFRNVEVGVVSAIRIDPGLTKIIAEVEMEPGSGPYLNKNTKFWVVRPRLDAGGVSGLGTLVSGAYIEFEPGDGEKTRSFRGLEEPPVVITDAIGTTFMLRAASLGSLSPKSPIYFRGLKVGEILGHSLDKTSSSVSVRAFVEAPHDKLVRASTRFWNASGITVDAGSDGFKIHMASVQAMLAGGVVFETPAIAAKEPPAEANSVFPLYENREASRKRVITVKTPYLLEFTDSVRGLEPGAPVEFRGVRIGTVSDLRFEINYETFDVSVLVIIEIEPERIKNLETKGKPTTDSDPYSGMAMLVEKGLRAQLQTSSLLTGKQFVSLDFEETATAKKLRMDGVYPEIPTIPSTINQIADVAQRILLKIEKLPIDVLVNDIRKVMRTLNATLGDAQSLVRNVDDDIQPLMDEIQTTLRKADSALANIDSAVAPESDLRLDLAATLQELAGAARSIRLLTEYLERHPEALVRGKTGDAQ